MADRQHNQLRVPVGAVLDIEHTVVEDDPRTWSRTRKLSVVATVSAASMITGLGASIYNPAIPQIEEQLRASSGEISLSLALFTLLQGCVPLLWTTLSEFWGRKKVYLLSTALCLVGCIVSATSKTIGVLIGMRCIQAIGSSAVMSLGAATLADIYEPRDRGTMMGIYYSAPLLGPSLGPILGGALTQAFDWRATFWFLAIFVGVCFLLFIPLKDTYRRERSLVYQAAVKRRVAQNCAKAFDSEASSLSQVTAAAAVLHEGDAVHANTSGGGVEKHVHAMVDDGGDVEGNVQSNTLRAVTLDEVKLSLADVNPVQPIVQVLRWLNNVVIYIASGLIFAFSYSIAYTCSRTLANEYGYNALQIGLTLLAFGIGSLFGSVLGGRYSDHVFRKLKARYGEACQPEMRLESTVIPILLLWSPVIAYGWVCERHVNVAAICVMLFLAGFFSICIHSCQLAYIVDANTGRSSSAVATNSAIRGTSAFIASEVAVPLQNAIGDGGLYSLWAGLMIVSGALTIIVLRKGGAWRERCAAKEGQHK